MFVFNVKRITSTTDGTFGVLLHKGNPLFLTLEPPWKNNEKYVSCIPQGGYYCERRHSQRFETDVFQILNVENRTSIIIHPGNLLKDTHGCILIGTSFGEIGNHYGILQSKRAFGLFMFLMKNETVMYLDITQWGRYGSFRFI